VPAANPNDGPAIDIEPAVLEIETPEVQPTRASILAAFNRKEPPPERAAPPTTSPQPAPQPRPARQAAPAEPEMSDEGWEEVIAGFVAGNVNWNRRRLGGEPGSEDCRAPRSVLRRFGL